MKKKRKKLYLSNEGFSLMELIVTMLVSAVVTAAVAGFLVAGVQFYNRANAETTVQMESQVAELFITELLQESSAHEFVTSCPTGVDGALIVDRNEVDGEGDALESIVVRKDDQLWYGTAKKSDPVATKISTVSAKAKSDAFLADCVTSFSVIEDSGNGLVQLNMQFEEANKKYDCSSTIALRNKKRN